MGGLLLGEPESVVTLSFVGRYELGLLRGEASHGGCARATLGETLCIQNGIYNLEYNLY